MNTKRWTKHIRDNIKRACGKRHLQCTEGSLDKGCKENKYWNEQVLGWYPYFGIEMNVKINSRHNLDDDRGCIESAIRKASCGLPFRWTNNGCYRSDSGNKDGGNGTEIDADLPHFPPGSIDEDIRGEDNELPPGSPTFPVGSMSTLAAELDVSDEA